MLLILTSTDQYPISTVQDFSDLFGAEPVQTDHHQPGLTLFDVTQTFAKWGLSYTVQGNEVRITA